MTVQCKTTVLHAIKLFILMAVLLKSTTACAADDVYQDEVKELFLDDVEIEAVNHVKRILHQPTLVQPEPVLRAELPWEGQMVGPCSVIYDPTLKLLRMWYRVLYPETVGRSAPLSLKGKTPEGKAWQVEAVAYAESKDGIHWQKRKLGRISLKGKDTNLALRGWAGPSVAGVIFRPTHPDPRERYRMFVWDYIPTPGCHSVYGMTTYVSQDGFDWKGLEWDSENTGGYRDPQPFCYLKHVGNYRYPTSIGPGECHGIFWDERINKYVDYCRGNNGSVRTVCRIESDDGIHWTRPDKMVLQPDLKDPFRTQFYEVAALRSGENIILMVQCAEMQKWTIDCQLAASRDGENFTRVADRRVFVPNGPPGSATAGMVYPIAPVSFQDRWLVYALGCSKGHNEPDREYTIVLYEMRPDGFVSFRAGAREGSLVTRAFTWLHDSVKINADAIKGHIALEVYDGTRISDKTATSFDDVYPEPIKGFSREDCIPLRADALDHKFRFKDADLSQLRGKYVRLRFYFKNADFYSWTRYRKD